MGTDVDFFEQVDQWINALCEGLSPVQSEALEPERFAPWDLATHSRPVWYFDL